MKKATFSVRGLDKVFLLPLALAALSGSAQAWGPHPEITQAALATLRPEDALLKQLGGEAVRLREYCWMPDMRRTLYREPRGWFYTDDFLLLPSLPLHCDHLCPAVKAAYQPFFCRALQALRTENAPNAVRWLGSLVHFTEDSGAPPHAAEISGELHSRLEEWLDAKAISIRGYRPQLLGTTDEEALAGYLKRMDGLIEFSKARAERARPSAIRGDRTAVEPILLESALESSRVTADLLRTLGELAAHGPTVSSATLRGSIFSQPTPELEKLAAKVLLLGTPFSTLADGDGRYVFSHLPPGHYQVAVLRPGSAVGIQKVTLRPGAETVADVRLSPDQDSSNMVRNASLSLQWLAAGRPDAWYPRKSQSQPSRSCWEGELLPLRAGTNYRLRVVWQDQATGYVSVRLFHDVNANGPPRELTPIRPGQAALDFASSRDAAFAQVVIYGDGSPEKTCKHVSVRKRD